MKSTDRLEEEQHVSWLKGLLTATKDGRIFSVETGAELGLKDRCKGYLGVSFKGSVYLKHRLVYALLNGAFCGNIDHINRNTKDNRCANLRVADRSTNTANSGKRSDNTSGYIGVVWHKATGMWQAQTMLKGKRLHIGLFNCKEEAALAYNYRLEKLFGPMCTFNQVFEDQQEPKT